MNAKDKIRGLYDPVPMASLRDVQALERVPLDERIPFWNVNDWIRHGCELDPAKPAIHYVENADPHGPCVTISYGDLQARGHQAANFFHSLGLGPKDVVFFLLPTVPQLFVVTMGAIQVGIACGANWMLKPDHLVELIESSKAKVVVALGPTPGYEIWENVEAALPRLKGVKVFSVQGPGGRKLADSDFDSQLDRQPTKLTFERTVRPEEVAAYVHSGGTTGAPKLVQLTHRGMSYKCWANAVVMNHSPRDTILADYPMFHIAGIFGRGILALANGMTILVPTPMGARDKTFIANYWKFVEKFKVSVMSGVPTTLSVLAKNPPTTEDISSLRRYMCTGSTAMPAEVAREIEEATGVRVLATYGATEFTQNVTQGPRDGDPKYGSAGLPLPYTEVKVVQLNETNDEILRECAPDEIGAVIMRGPSITPGYVDSRYNEGFFVKGGWINNGDLGRIDRDGYLWITGRAKDLIIRGGHNIDPTVIEETLRRHKEVLLVAAVSKPDAYAGELPVAYVQLVKGAKASGEDIAAFAREHITERAAAPKEVYVLDEMPLTDVQKPNKVKLRQDAARRAFTEALEPAIGKVAVDVGPDPTHGTLAVIRPAVSDDHAAVEKKVHEVMKAYAMKYEVRW